MVSSQRLTILALFVVLSIEGFSNGQSICQVPVNGLMECKPAVTPPNPAPPSATCCAALTHADFNCLCRYKKSQMLASLGIDPNLAFQLPQKCKLPQQVNC